MIDQGEDSDLLDGVFSCSGSSGDDWAIRSWLGGWAHTSSELAFPSFSVSKCASGSAMSFPEREDSC
jgi:hypothetical protein